MHQDDEEPMRLERYEEPIRPSGAAGTRIEIVEGVPASPDLEGFEALRWSAPQDDRTADVVRRREPPSDIAPGTDVTALRDTSGSGIRGEYVAPNLVRETETGALVHARVGTVWPVDRPPLPPAAVEELFKIRTALEQDLRDAERAAVETARRMLVQPRQCGKIEERTPEALPLVAVNAASLHACVRAGRFGFPVELDGEELVHAIAAHEVDGWAAVSTGRLVPGTDEIELVIQRGTVRIQGLSTEERQHHAERYPPETLVPARPWRHGG